MDTIDAVMMTQLEQTETHNFNFPGLPVWFDQSGYIRVLDAINKAALLFGDGGGGDLGENAEYERGILEIFCDIFNIPSEFLEQLRSLIYSVSSGKRF